MTMTWRRVKRWDMRGRWGRKASCPAARLSTRTLAGRRQFRNRRRGFGRREDHKEWWIVGKQSWPSGRQVKFQEKARPRLERVSSNGEELLTPAGKVSGAWAVSKPILKLASSTSKFIMQQKLNKEWYLNSTNLMLHAVCMILRWKGFYIWKFKLNGFL